MQVFADPFANIINLCREPSTDPFGE
jgi:hypothetical protein